jgi:tRNA (guanine-N7-)-methyltransferase
MTTVNVAETTSESTIVTPLSWTRRLNLQELYPAPGASLEVDLGCGKGRFLAAKAKQNPGVNYLGVDRLLVRLRKADKKANRLALTNLRLLRVEVSYAVEHLLPKDSVSVCYIFFPDPWPKRRHHRRRLINDAFINSLNRAMRPGGRIHIATDHENYIEEIRECFRRHEEFKNASILVPTEEEQTEFERIFVSNGESIGRCSYAKVSDVQGLPTTNPTSLLPSR